MAVAPQEEEDRPPGRSQAHRTGANRWRTAGEVSVLVLKLLAAAAALDGAVNGCGPT
jgi:hypothetical protein